MFCFPLSKKLENSPTTKLNHLAGNLSHNICISNWNVFNLFLSYWYWSINRCYSSIFSPSNMMSLDNMLILWKQEKLGTMLDKMMRVQHMVSEVSLALGIIEETLEIIQEAASLAMSDLATAVVTEFTSLSGIMARHYALKDGYSEQVSGVFKKSF